jgi:hypothetical protein
MKTKLMVMALCALFSTAANASASEQQILAKCGVANLIVEIAQSRQINGEISVERYYSVVLSNQEVISAAKVAEQELDTYIFEKDHQQNFITASLEYTATGPKFVYRLNGQKCFE